MTEMVLDIDAVPELLFAHITSKRVRYILEDGAIKIMPVAEEKRGYKHLKGLLANSGITVDDLHRETRKDKELEYEGYSRF
jgi:hypothetical protein